MAKLKKLEITKDSSTITVSTKLDTEETYSQILRSSSLVGMSSLLNILIGIVRMKVMALFLGPAGVGLFSVYASIVTLTQTFAGMGINSSGVRQIALAKSSKNYYTIDLTISILRRISIVLGTLGGMVLVLFSKQISSLTFGNREHAPEISALAVAVFLTLIGAGQSALLQGLRRISDFAKTNVLGALLGTILSLPLVYLYGKSAIVFSLIGIAAMSSFASWWYSHSIKATLVDASLNSIAAEVYELLKLGIAFMTSGLLTLGVAYVVRIMVLRKIGIEATGLYQSAWTLGGLYVGFILQAMGADFYPRLTAQINDDITSNRLVNEQTQVGILLGVPGILATLTLAPSVIALLYTAKFALAVGILRWICLGTIIQVISWPLGFIIIAKARKTLFVLCETAWAIVSLGFAWVCIGRYGLTGAGIAFFGSYIFHAIFLYIIVNNLTGFQWSMQNKLSGSVFLSIIAVIFTSYYFMQSLAAEMIGIFATIFCSAYSIKSIANLVSFKSLPVTVNKVITMFCGSTSCPTE